MIRTDDSRRSLFRGWWIVLVSAVGMSFSTETMVVYTFGIFAKPLALELKTNRGSIAFAVSLLDIVVAFAAPGAGRLVDRFGARGGMRSPMRLYI
jgi:MFS family permease